ncbi:MAG: PAS domain S-box protein [Anaerolineaceae bacterium]
MLKTFIQQSSDSIVVLDPLGMICEWNPASEVLSGFAADEVLNKPSWEIFYQMSLPKHQTPEKLEYFKKIILQELQNGAGPNFGKTNRLVLISKFGEELNIQQFAFLIQIDKRNHIACVTQDIIGINERNRAEQRLRESEKQLHVIMDNAPVGIFIIDSAFKFLYVNNEICRIVGYGREEFINHDFTYFLDENNRSFLVDSFLLWQKGEQVSSRYQIDFRHKDGRMRRAEITASVFNDGKGKVFTVGQLLDITEHQQVEESINQRNQELEALAKITAAMRQAQKRADIYSIILQQSIELLKAGGAALVIYEPSSNDLHIELSQLAWKEWSNEFGAIYREITRQTIESGKVYCSDTIGHLLEPTFNSEVAYRVCIPMAASQQPIGALWFGRAYPFLDSDLRLLNAISDMAANAIYRQTLHENLLVQLESLRQTQARLLQSEKLAAIGQLVSGVAHELNNPLTSVVLYSQLVQQEIQDPAAQQNMAKVVSEAMRAGKIVHGLLDFARQRPIQREQIQVNTVLITSVDLVSYELISRNIKLDLFFAPELPFIMADPHQLQQVFVNLLQNAWQAIETVRNEGSLEISTEVSTSKFATPSGGGEKVIRIMIKDNGPGISEDDLNRIFDPFFTTKAEGEGTGLGLSVCHGIVEEHGGYIWAESTFGMGTTFFIELPIAPIRAAEIHENALGHPLSGGAKETKILIIDDEPNVKDVLAQSLRRWGYQVDAVGNGIDGFNLLAKTAYSHILCDIRMPGFNGVEFYQQVKAKDPALAGRIIFITGDTANKATHKFIEENKVNYLSKPFELSDLLRMIQSTEKDSGNKP